ncbi:MAG: ferrous iron transport protein B [Bacteroidetes bacterium CG2_30_33_31]|nr:MAG: ferrous iron transport protein B [Bacteroidetes bacterium CG2_30_33_31]
MKLSDLKEGEKGIITKVRGRGAFRRRIMEMGFVVGKEVLVIKFAPLMDPVEYSIMGYQISLRHEETELIEVFQSDEKTTMSDNYFGTFQERSHYNKGTDAIEKIIKVAFVGNPNCGKTTIFNQVTGLHEKVGNYGGVTVDSKNASYKYKGIKFELTDLPGTYSLTAFTPEELFVRKHVINEMPDVVVNIIDGSNLERNLYLTTQLIDMDIKVVGAINMFDEMENHGDFLNSPALSSLLGIPFIETIGKKNIGINKLFDKIIEVFEDKDPIVRHIHINYGKYLEESIKDIQKYLKIEGNHLITNKISSRFLAIKLLEEDSHAIEIIEKCGNKLDILESTNNGIQKIENYYNDKVESAITDAKYGFIDGALKETYKKNIKPDKRLMTKVIDDIITNRLYSFPIFIFFMWVMFQATFFVGAYPQEWLTWLVDKFGAGISQLLPDGMIKALIVNGIIGGVGGVLVFLPNILILFFFISIMEDTGYMARVAFIVDKIMHRVGLHGRSFIPLLMGFGCNVPAIMATRTIEGRNDRLITILITPFMSCSARLPVYVLIISAFFPKYPGSTLFLVYTIGILMAGAMALVFRKTLLKAKELPFVMELPPYRLPTGKTIVKHMWFKAELYLKKMGGFIMIASILIWALNYFPTKISFSKNYDELQNKVELKYQALSNQNNAININHDSINILKNNELKHIKILKESERSEKSFIGQIGHFIEPTIKPLGFDWRMGISIITGMAAKEIVISTMGVLYQSDVADEGSSNLKTKLQNAKFTQGPHKGENVYNKASAFAFIIFILFYFPCVAVIAAVKREAGGWKWALFVAVYTTTLAWIFAFAAFQIGSLFL